MLVGLEIIIVETLQSLNVLSKINMLVVKNNFSEIFDPMEFINGKL